MRKMQISHIVDIRWYLPDRVDYYYNTGKRVYTDKRARPERPVKQER